jgi:hypothetical protein
MNYDEVSVFERADQILFDIKEKLREHGLSRADVDVISDLIVEYGFAWYDYQESMD